VLGALILTFGPVSGAHFNPVVSAADWLLGHRASTGLTVTDLTGCVAAQVAGAIAGSVLANLMFALAPVSFSHKDRSAGHLWIGEVVAPASIPGFVIAQLIGLLIGVGLLGALYPTTAATADEVVVEHDVAGTSAR
jgi:glycerol uptake facilitator-like aquaporin